MKIFQSSQDRDDELLSAYLDNELSPADRARLESRLKTDSRLRATLQGLRLVKTNLGALPQVKPPRSFTLTAEMAGRPARQPSRLLPALNMATALAALLFAVVIAADLSSGMMVREAAPQAGVAQAPLEEFSAESAGEADTATVQDAAAETATSEAAALIQIAPPMGESSAEPLTGGSGGGGGGGAGGGGPGVPPSTESDGGVGGAVDGTELQITANSLTATPSLDAVRSAVADETPALAPEPSEVPAPDETPPGADTFFEDTAVAKSTPSFNWLRLLQVGLALLFVLLAITSVLLRRR